MPETKTSSSPQRRPGGRTRRHSEQIYAAARRLLGERGYSGLTFLDVAQAAGVNRSTLYRRWESIAELVQDAVGAEVAEQIAAPDTGSLEGDMRTVLRRIVAYISTPVGTAALAASLEIGETQADGPRAPRWRTRLADFDAMFDRAQARGEITAAFDRETAFSLAAGALYFRRIVAGQPLDEAWIERVLALWTGKLDGA